jgi:hypothetical protein
MAPLPKVAAWNQPEARRVPGLDGPTVIIFRDSFGRSVIPFLAEHFRRSLNIHSYALDDATIVRERPELVIQEIAERELQGVCSPWRY